MIRLLIVGVLAAVTQATTPFASAQVPQFSSLMDDLPLPAQFVEDSQGSIFSSPFGRILVVSGTCSCSTAVMRQFYLDILPRFGWKLEAPGNFSFVRAAERLEISFQDNHARSDPAAPNARKTSDVVSVARFRLIAPAASARLAE